MINQEYIRDSPRQIWINPGSPSPQAGLRTGENPKQPFSLCCRHSVRIIPSREVLFAPAAAPGVRQLLLCV